jgi:hypothetical protein
MAIASGTDRRTFTPGTVKISALSEEAFNQTDVAGLDGSQEAFSGWRSLQWPLLLVGL